MSPSSWHHHTCKSPAVHTEGMDVDVPDMLSIFTHVSFSAASELSISVPLTQTRTSPIAEALQ